MYLTACVRILREYVGGAVGNVGRYLNTFGVLGKKLLLCPSFLPHNTANVLHYNSNHATRANVQRAEHVLVIDRPRGVVGREVVK